MFANKTIMNIARLLGLVSLLLLLACNSKGTDSSESNAIPESFIAADGTTGTIVLDIVDQTISVSETTSFSAKVRDVNGNAVSDIRVSCDSEQGLAILEPTQGTFLTDDFGNASGVVGCAANGSFRVGCRLPVGGNKRVFASVNCSGVSPIGFAGFPNSAGGGLGGGVDSTNDNNNDNDDFNVRVVSIQFNDIEDNTKSIDIEQGFCPDGSGEPFKETEVIFEIENNSSQIVRIDSYRYTMENFDNGGSNFTSDILSFIGEQSPEIDANGDTGSFRALFLQAPGFGKQIPFDGPTLLNGVNNGFKNVEFTLFGVDSSGEQVTLTARESLSLNNFDNC